uniref:Hypothetical chloroplast RF20 n=1 Tax=Sykidion marinum TaxID=44573 RepID=A0A1W6EGL0_SYKMA|nr:hypothetical chloroplast RF20 [Pseudoneochloris marina]ARK14532.1 hypothetical chloroplast RF20 [Pseudoneochloris marina]
MNSNTNFFNLLNKINFNNQAKIKIFKKILTFSVFSLFLGFVCGNLFGTFLGYFRNYTNWDGFIIMTTILIIEFINYLNYKKDDKFSKKTSNKPNNFSNLITPDELKINNNYNFEKNTKLNTDLRINKTTKNQKFSNIFLVNKLGKKKHFLKFLNFYKIGLLLGFFIDAFKVGS